MSRLGKLRPPTESEMTPAPSSRSGREKKPRRVSLKMTPASSSRSEREKERFRGVLEKQGPPPTKSPGSSERLLIEEKALLGPGHDRYAAIARYLGSCNNVRISYSSLNLVDNH